LENAFYLQRQLSKVLKQALIPILPVCCYICVHPRLKNIPYP